VSAPSRSSESPSQRPPSRPPDSLPSGEAQIEPRLLDARQAAEYLGTSPRHLRRLVSERALPVRHLGGKVRFARADLDRWVEDCCPPEVRSTCETRMPPWSA
jgi:excisionase family DNA binding protein